MSPRVMLALVCAAFSLSGSLHAQYNRTFTMTPAPHFGAAFHPAGPMRPGVPAATSGPKMMAPVRQYGSGNYQGGVYFNQNHFRNFNQCYYNANCRYFPRRRVVYYPVAYPYPVYAEPYYENPAPETQVVYQQPAYPAYNDNSAQVNSQLERLTYEVEQLRADQEGSRHEQQHQEAAATPKDLGPITPTVLVFADGRRMEIHNYAIVGKIVWILSDHTASQKVQLADLDLSATKKANDENGVDFVIP